MKFNPLLPDGHKAMHLTREIEAHVNHRLDHGDLKEAYSAALAGANNKFQVAATLIRREVSSAKKMILKKNAHGHGDHDDHGHGHHQESDHKEIAVEKDADALASLYEKILSSVKGQMLYLYESGNVSMTTLCIAT